MIRLLPLTKQFLCHGDRNHFLSALKPLSFGPELFGFPRPTSTLPPGGVKRRSLQRRNNIARALLCRLRKLQFRSVSTGINYLDTWIGQQTSTRKVGPALDSMPTSCHLGRRSPSTRVKRTSPSFSQEPSSPSFANSLPKIPLIPNAFANLRPSSLSCDQIIDLGLPSAEYMIFTMRLDRSDTPKSLLQKLDELSKQAQNNRVKIGKRTTDMLTIPLVLDFSAFHPDGSPHYKPPPVDTLSGFVNAVRSRGDSTQQSCMNGLVYLVVGVTNLPPIDKQCQGHVAQMTREAQLLNVPIFSNSHPQERSSILKHQPSPLPTIEGGSIKKIGMIEKRKKRGGVAPLLRPRRPGVDSRPTLLEANEKRHSHITSGNVRLTQSNDDSGSCQHIYNLRLESMVANNSAAKVHKGSVRSGQTVSTDEPNQSLIILGCVNPGGEILSEGDVYVFGKLKGRVLAGLGDKRGYDCNKSRGDEDKLNATMAAVNATDDRDNSVRPGYKIIATSFDPELVCIGDKFTTVDDVKELGLDGVGPALVSLDEESGELVFERVEF